MIVMARTNRFSHDEQRNRYVANWRFPPDVRALTGMWFRYRAPMHTSPAQAVKLEAVKLVEYNTLIDAARARLGTPEGDHEALQNIGAWIAEIRKTFPTITAGLAAMDQRNARREDEEALRRLSERLGLPMPSLTPATGKRVDSEEVIKAWITKRTNEGNAPGPQALQAKRSKLARLLAFTAGARDLPARLNTAQVDEWLARGNLADVTNSVMQQYLGKLAREGGRREADAYIDLHALIEVALLRGLISVDPFTIGPFRKIEAPKKISGSRDALLQPEAAAILRRARGAIEAGDVIQWAHPLAYFGCGLINSEILNAMASEVRQLPDDGFGGAWVFDLSERRLKDSREGEGSGYRPRIIPIHPVLEAWGFIEYARSRAGKRLFDATVDTGGAKLNALIDAALIDAGFETHLLKKGKLIHKTFYWWRHTSTTKLGRDEIAFYLSGHAGTLHDSYRHVDRLPEEFSKVIAAVPARIPDPTV